jgi:hypothetical protein
VFYRDEKGRQPVREFLLKRLTPRALARIEEQIEEMNRLPDPLPPLSFPWTSQVEGGLREQGAIAEAASIESSIAGRKTCSCCFT